MAAKRRKRRKNGVLGSGFLATKSTIGHEKWRDGTPTTHYPLLATVLCSIIDEPCFSALLRTVQLNRTLRFFDASISCGNEPKAERNAGYWGTP